LSFGDLVDKNSDPVTNIKSYEVWMLQKGRLNVKIATLTARKRATGDQCCNMNKYSIKVLKTVSTTPAYDGTDRLAITAVSNKDAKLPAVAVTNAIADKVDGEVKSVTGDFSMVMSSADSKSLLSSASMNSLGKALANTIPGVGPDQVFITGIFFDGVLQTTSTGRRLASVTVKVAYEILLAAGATDIKTADINPATLATNIKAEQAKIGNTVTIEGDMTVSQITVAVVGTPVVEQTGSASALFFPSMAAVIAVVAQLMF